MMTFLYKEPLELLVNTLNNIKSMEDSNEFIVVIGME